MNENISVRRATLEDAECITEFISETYGDEAKYKVGKRWYWQFIDNPRHIDRDGEPTVWVAEESDRIVGQIALQDTCVLVDGKRLHASWIVDVMIRPSHRGMGIGHEIHREILKERDVLITLTMATATRRIAMRSGAVTLNSVASLLLPLNVSANSIDRFFQSKLTSSKKIVRCVSSLALKYRFLPNLASFLLCFLSKRLSRAKSSYDVSISEIDRFDGRFDKLWGRLNSEIKNGVIRDSVYLNWRFFEVPDLKYRCFSILYEKQLVGYLVIREHSSEELAHGTIVDICIDHDEVSILEDVIRFAIQELYATSEFILAATSVMEYRKAYLKVGFIEIKTHYPTIVCRDRNLSAIIEDTVEAWFLNRSDHDWDQIHPY